MLLTRSCRLSCRQYSANLRTHGMVNLRCCSSIVSRPDRVFSGIQPTGVLHIGNFLGVVKNWVDIQNKSQNVICSIVDLHSMTLPYASKLFLRLDTQKLSHHILLMTACLLGCGVDPEKSILFLQSDIPQHTQLCWILSISTTMRRLALLPQYTEKSECLTNNHLGLLWYPVLQAADILIYRATQVPVGKDQLQHLQLASSLARRFNSKYGETFPVPQAILNELTNILFTSRLTSLLKDVFDLKNNDHTVAKIKNLQDPTKKMSKSSPDRNSRIDITDSPDVIASKLKLMSVERNSPIIFSPVTKPGISNLVAMHAALTGRQAISISDEFRNYKVEKYKEIVTETLVETLKPIQNEIERLLKNKQYVVSTLSKGAFKATEIATETWRIVSEKTGTDFFARMNK